ncbi:MAG: hypothetical protein FDX18_00150 [Chlorobium sp.]|nr:MAG: hypothetical protein FDX18_00150 [Chlorobium sp.]
MLLINRFIRLIEDHAESLTLQCVQNLRTNPLTASYGKLTKEQLHDIVYSRFRKIGQWIGKQEGRDRDIAQEFCEIGAQGAKSGIKASEMIYSFMLERDLLWSYILDEGIVTEGIDLNRAIEFSHQLNYFYEKAIYFALVGHESQQVFSSETKDEGVFDKIFEGFKHWIVVK